MNEFTYNSNSLYCENVSVNELADKYGTPLYIYSRAAIEGQIKSVATAFKEVSPLIAFSVKSNSNIGLLSVVKQAGAGADIVSGGELYRCLKAGISPQKIVFAGVGKSDEEIAYAIDNNIKLFNAESMEEMAAISRVAVSKKASANVSFRVNPDVDAKTHEKTTTGKKENKFGIPYEKAVEMYMAAAKLPGLIVSGIDVHLGSPIYTTEPYVAGINRLLPIIDELRKNGIPLKTLDIGGGIAIVYNDEKPFLPAELAEVTVPLIKKSGLECILEPGRFIAGNSGIMVSKVTYVKKTGYKNFVIVDAGMNDLIRPAFYGSYHGILPVVKNESRSNLKADVVGPICESSDCFAKDREIAEPLHGEYLSFMSAGAYGFTMASNYNTRRRPCELLVHGNKVSVIRKREEWADLIAGESVPE
ncbi:MAG: diaminopimelate decarboxylase [Fibrobacteres bacterium]|nr:diaminopimelate decarboxylase [Fibrobacterota bacterium]